MDSRRWRRGLVAAFRPLLPYVAFCVYRSLAATWRIRVHESDSLKRLRAAGSTAVFAHWHGEELAILYLLRPYRASTMISTSEDGSLMARLVELLGSRTARGSSTRGGTAALRGLLRLTKEGWNPSVAVDGPKGPIYVAKPGVFELSRVLSAPVFPLAAATDRAWRFTRTWNQAYLPKPFARIEVVWGEAIPALDRDDDPRLSIHADRLAAALNSARAEATNLIAAP
jgi:lysophospholipid acyltransferase (LPLAT)-like uncharacterized protein